MSLHFRRKFDKYRILQEKAPWEVARNAFEIALEFALLGHIDTATELYNLFHSAAPENKAIWSPGLIFAWDATRQWPESIPLQDQTAEVVSKLEIERIIWKRQTHASDEGIEKLIKSATPERDPIKPDHLTAALDLALFTNRTETATRILDIFAENLDLTWTSLARSRYAWNLLKDRALSRAIRVKAEKMSEFEVEVLSTFRNWMNNGPQRRFKDVSVTSLVQMCNQHTLRNAIWEEVDVDEPPATILRPGATEDEILALESRLGHSLPRDYREFLAASNGLGPVWNGIDCEPIFLDTTSVHLFDASEEQKSWQKASVEVMFITDISKKIDWATLDRVIQINRGDASNRFVWLVEPEYSQKLVESFTKVFVTLPEDEQARIRKRIEVFIPPIDAAEGFADVGWQLFIWEPGSLERTIVWSFREYLEDLAGNAMEGGLEEESAVLRTQDVFAYTLR